jgi:hypothetical protein
MSLASMTLVGVGEMRLCSSFIYERNEECDYSRRTRRWERREGLFLGRPSSSDIWPSSDGDRDLVEDKCSYNHLNHIYIAIVHLRHIWIHHGSRQSEFCGETIIDI